MRAEGKMQQELVEWIKDKYPTLMFFCDLSSGMPLPIHLAKRNKNLQFTSGMPDIYIFEARNGYHGLFMELKHESSQQIKKDGTMGNEKHIAAQRIVHGWFQERGYMCDFFIGLENCKLAIINYLK